jgi:UDP-3-O-[3-hydroxymyristoyl] glucosamine N-acyltransferase
MKKTLKEIAELVRGEVTGDENTVITGVAGIREACEGEITFLSNPKYLSLLKKTAASAVVTSRDIKDSSKPLIRTDNPSLAFAKIVSSFSPSEIRHPKGVHPTAILGKDVKLGKAAALGAYVVIGDEVSIGDNSIIYSGCFIGHNTKIGKDNLIYPNVSIRENITIGDRVIIHSGTVIGSDGFGYATIDGKHHKIPQTGTVEIGDDVEIGANVTVDRARFDNTIIGKGTKIDNLVQIAHNVVIGEDCIIVSQTGISGSTVLGKNVTIAGQVGIVGHVTIGDRVVIMAQSGVTKSLAPDTVVWGTPAKIEDSAKKINACVHNLPRLFETVSSLRKKIAELEEKLKSK